MGGGDVLGPRAVGRDPRRPGPGPGQPGHPGAARRRPQGPHRGVRRQGGRRRGVVAGGGRRHQGRGRGDHRLHRGGQGRPGRRPGAVRHDVQAVRASTCCGCATRAPTRSCGWPASSSTTRSSSSSSTRRRSQQLVRGEGPAVDGEVWVQRLSMLGGVTLVGAGHRVGQARRRDRRRLRLGSGSRGRRRDRGDRVAGADGDARPRAAGHRRGRRSR